MKTVVIWDSCGVDPIKFFIVPRDVTHLNGVYLNLEGDEKLQDELNLLAWDEKGKPLLKMLKRFPTKAVKSGAAVIVCGMAP
jgi:hypothetical protein